MLRSEGIKPYRTMKRLTTGTLQTSYITMFVVRGGFIYIDKIVDGNMLAYDDGFTILEIARKYYQEVGLDPALLDAMIR